MINIDKMNGEIMKKSLSDIQWEFLQDMTKLVMYAAIHGFKLTLGEGFRPQSMQNLYFTGNEVRLIGTKAVLSPAPILTKTLTSRHGQRLAIDFNIFKDIDESGNKILLSSDAAKLEHAQILGDYWNSLNEFNISGFNWKWDTSHFERLPQ
jgi:hypothetical protein